VDRLQANIDRMTAAVEAVRQNLGGTPEGAARARWRAHLDAVAGLAKGVGTREELSDLAGQLQALADGLKQRAEALA
jgi:hypothetical protein